MESTRLWERWGAVSTAVTPQQGRPEICLLPALWAGMGRGRMAFVSFGRPGWNPEEVLTRSAVLYWFSCAVYLAPTPLFRTLGQVPSVQVLVGDLFVGATVSVHFALVIQQPSWQ